MPEYPKYKVQTPFGEYTIYPHGDTASLGWDDDDTYLLINGIAIRGRIYMRYERHRTFDRAKADELRKQGIDYDGVDVDGWRLDPKSGGPYLKRADGKEATDNQRRKIYDELLPWAANWLANHPDAVREGYRFQLSYNLERATDARNKAADELRAAEAEMLKRRLILDDFNGGTPPALPTDMCTCGHLRQYHDNGRGHGERVDYEGHCSQYQPGENNYRRCQCEGFNADTH